jgi:HAD superfamily hydrolase (TIGR01549 family)
MRYDTVVLDVDGTLLDSNYHHALAWSRAFAAQGRPVSLWRIHRHIGMGGDKLVAAVTDDDFEESHGDRVRDRWKAEYDEVIEQTRLFDGARELLARLRDAGADVALASSSIPEHAQHAFDLLDASDLADTATTSEDAEDSKPDPGLIEEALRRVDAERACVVGDSVWDVEAGLRAGVPTYALLAGGYGEAELKRAGAVAVYDDVSDLLAHWSDWAG